MAYGEVKYCPCGHPAQEKCLPGSASGPIQCQYMCAWNKGVETLTRTLFAASNEGIDLMHNCRLWKAQPLKIHHTHFIELFHDLDSMASLST